MEEKNESQNIKTGKHFLGPTIALFFGIFIILGSIGSGLGLDARAGLAIILGALVYKSIKKRRLGLAKPTGLRRGLEIIGILIIAFYFVIDVILKSFPIVSHPISTIAYVWALVAIIIAYQKQAPANSKIV